ncbi:HAMP domain-containing protein [Undibacterium sp. Di24W]|uniref:HAMP domain-containing protein n=1 Tax=Undibacterium sp. Di24W TaxID=3413033 RepID=UPI003BF42757
MKNLLDATVQEKQSSLARIFLILAFTLRIFFIFGRRFSKLVSAMTHASQKIASGKFQQVITVAGQDELSVLMEHFNLMALQVNEMRQSFQDGSIKKSKIDQYVKTIEDAASLILVNVTRAASLIRSFKTIAVNQTSESRAHFKLLDLLMALESTVRLQAKHKTIRFDIDVAKSIELDSFPGALTQVFVNLFANAVIYGFEGGDVESILLHAERHRGDSDPQNIDLSADGVGIRLEHIFKIFDPLFTNQLGQCGAWLACQL